MESAYQPLAGLWMYRRVIPECTAAGLHRGSSHGDCGETGRDEKYHCAQGMNVVGFDYLREVVQFLEEEKEYAIQQEVDFNAPAEDPIGKGVNRLIAEGAHIYLHPSQLLPDCNSIDAELDREFIPFTHEQRSNEIKRTNETRGTIERMLTPIEKKIISSLSLTPKTIEQISKDTDLDQLQLIEVLSMMELEGLIQTYPGGRFSEASAPVNTGCALRMARSWRP